MTTTQRRSFTEKLGLLRELELFSGLSETDIEAIGHATTMTHCHPGQVILSPLPEFVLQEGDIILKFDGKDVTTMRGLPRLVAQTPIGKDVDVEILRKGQKRSMKVAVGRLTEDDMRGALAAIRETLKEMGMRVPVPPAAP